MANNNKEPQLVQVQQVQRNPFVPEQIEPRPNVKVVVSANPTKQYVPVGTHGYYPFLQAKPPYIDDISQQFGLQVYDQMMRDPVVYAGERVFTLGLLANGYEIVPSLSREEHDYDVSMAMCEFVKSNLNDLETPYEIVLANHLDAYEKGCSINELSWKVEGKTLRLKDVRDKPQQNAIFVTDSYNKTIAILTQRIPGQIYPASSFIPIDASTVTSSLNRERDNVNANNEYELSKVIPGILPRHLFSVLTNEMRFNDERGRSGLRTAYSAWWFKQQLIAEWLAFLSKFGSPSLVGKTSQSAVGQTVVDENLTPVIDETTGLPQTRTPEEVMAAALENFANGSAIAIPFDAEVTPIQVSGNGEAFPRAFAYLDMQITMGLTFQYLATMEGQHQARASSETHQDVLKLGILARKRWLAQQQQREIFRRILMYNFDITGKKIARYIPVLELGTGDGFPMTAQAISQLMSAGYLDESQKEGVDKKLGLPKREYITINGQKMTPSQKQEYDAQQQQQQMTQQQQEADNGFRQQELDQQAFQFNQQNSQQQ